jgi:hypothetical protein
MLQGALPRAEHPLDRVALRRRCRALDGERDDEQQGDPGHQNCRRTPNRTMRGFMISATALKFDALTS